MQLPELDYSPTMANAIRRASAQFGDRNFVVMPDRTMTFAEADLASRRVAKELVARGVGKGTRVAIHFSYGTDWVVDRAKALQAKWGGRLFVAAKSPAAVARW